MSRSEAPLSSLPVLDLSETQPSVPVLASTCRLVTLGCKVNQYETQLVKEGLERYGWREAAAEEPAALCVVNTCTVTAEADSKARQVIRQLAKANPGCATIVFGCYATRAADELSHLPGVVEVVADPRELPDVLQRFGVHDWPGGISRFDGHRRAFVKVQDGCLLNCTYCIIPAVRPGLRSREPADILSEIQRLVSNGYREIVLTGIHLGHFGVEATRGRSGRAPYRLWHLLREIDRLPGDFRVRLSSLEAAEVGDEFLQVVGDCQRLVPHFHLCLQSGSDRILESMKRRYRSGRFLEQVRKIRDRLHNPALSTDVIVGFPGETEEDFEQTLRVCETAEFLKIHAFPFSRRRGTPAHDFPDQVSPEIRQRRMHDLRELEARLQARYHSRLPGERLQVLVEARPAQLAGHVTGTACRYVPVEFPGGRSLLGQLCDVTVTEVRDGLVLAKQTESHP
ncbi:MAG: tRNA (N(6)-L-threonylcarbamoyladenosine(37)-C(2))-methylthiotransferase MtaB [Planctomycetaceae bacterium]